MDSSFILLFIGLYFITLMVISRLTSRTTSNSQFFLAGRKAPWYLVAFGMIGASLSGITFISIPGWVKGGGFGYMQMVLGYVLGYVFIAYVLLPVYYRLNLVSIYTYLEQRFGRHSYKTGAVFFLISRTIGAGIRLLLVANVLQYLVFSSWNIPFEITVLVSILLIWLYTYRGGLNTIVWTDTLQTAFMLISLILTMLFVANALGYKSISETFSGVSNSGYSQIFFFDDFLEKGHFVKHFFSGILIAIGMTGLDQDMMQKNLSCKNIKDAQKNMMSFTVVLVLVNFLFLSLGGLLYMYAEKNGISVPKIGEDSRPDLLFSEIALNAKLGLGVAIFFLLGLIAAAYSSADSALTSLTTSVSIDILEIDKKPEPDQVRIRKIIHIVMSVVLFIVILIIDKTLQDKSAIMQLIGFAGFVYGPLIGMYFFGLFTKLKVHDGAVPIVCLLSVIITALLWYYSFRGAEGQTPENSLFGNGYKFGAELIIVNSLVSFLGMYFCSLFARK